MNMIKIYYNIALNLHLFWNCEKLFNTRFCILNSVSASVLPPLWKTTVNRVIFAPRNFRPSTFENNFALEFARTQMCLKRDIVRHWNSPSLKLARRQGGRKGENKTRANIFLFTILSLGPLLPSLEIFSWILILSWYPTPPHPTGKYVMGIFPIYKQKLTLNY